MAKLDATMYVPGTSLGEKRLTDLIASTIATRTIDTRARGRGWLRELLRNGPLTHGVYAVIVDAEEARGFLVVNTGRVVFAETVQGDRVVAGDQALDELEGLMGEVRVSFATLRPRVVEWRPEELSVWVKGIDLQHRQLVNALNSLYQSILLGDTARQLSRTLRFLHEYTVFHFRSEERFFTRHGYPRAEDHMSQHRWFVRQVDDYTTRASRGEEVGLGVVIFLADWTRGHIAGSDRDWGRWIREHRED